jgi:outer membrane receptor protein involved in Fe transport
LAGGAVELNAAAFRSEFSDLQVAAWNGVAFETGNAAEATTQGLEVDGRWLINDNWMLSGALAFLDAEYDSFPGATCTAQQTDDHNASGAPGACIQDLSGRDLQFSPEVSGTINLEYIRTLNNGLELTAMLGADYSDAYYTALDLDPISRQDSFTKINARIAIAGEGGWSVALVGKNLTDEKTTMWINDMPFFRSAHFGAIDGLRNIGIQAKYEF